MEFDNFTLVFCNGEPPQRERLQNLVRIPARVVCADGGAQKALASGYTPDLIIGDLDSLEKFDELSGVAEIVKIDSQDNTDFEKTLDFMLKRGMDNFLVAAFSGGRIDQTLANIQIVFEYADRCRIVMADDHYVIVPVTGIFAERIPIGTPVSIIVMKDETSVTTDGLTFELRNKVMRKGGFGISNKSFKEEVKITVHAGGVLVLIKDA